MIPASHFDQTLFVTDTCARVNTSPLAASSEEVTLTPVHFQGVPYTPLLLLKTSFSGRMVADPLFSTACQTGFDDYFGEMYQSRDGEPDAFVERFYTQDEVQQRVVQWVIAAREDGVELSWGAGFTLGWLSALALTDRAGALFGAALLTRLVSVLSPANEAPANAAKETTDFHRGFEWGCEVYEEHSKLGDDLQTAQDVWTFLEKEFSPRMIAREKQFDAHLGTTPLSLEQRVGFIAGYLSRAFNPEMQHASPALSCGKRTC